MGANKTNSEFKYSVIITVPSVILVRLPRQRGQATAESSCCYFLLAPQPLAICIVIIATRLFSL